MGRERAGCHQSRCLFLSLSVDVGLVQEFRLMRTGHPLKLEVRRDRGKVQQLHVGDDLLFAHWRRGTKKVVKRCKRSWGASPPHVCNPLGGLWNIPRVMRRSPIGQARSILEALGRGENYASLYASLLGGGGKEEVFQGLSSILGKLVFNFFFVDVVFAPWAHHGFIGGDSSTRVHLSSFVLKSKIVC